MHIPKEKCSTETTGGKLVLKGWDGISVDYDWKTPTGHIFWDPLTRKTRLTRHLVFDERRVGIDKTKNVIADSDISSDNKFEAMISANDLNKQSGNFTSESLSQDIKDKLDNVESNSSTVSNDSENPINDDLTSDTSTTPQFKNKTAKLIAERANRKA